MRVGLNSGPVTVGAIGDDLRMDYTAVGDTTNLGSRMESMAGPGTVLVSGNTHRLVRDFFEFESLGKIKVKGKKEPQEAFELIKAGEVAYLPVLDRPRRSIRSRLESLIWRTAVTDLYMALAVVLA